MTQDLESLLSHGRVGEVCRLTSADLRAVLFERCRHWGLSRDLVDDALQETFLRVLRHHAQYRPWLSSAGTWLRTIAVRALIDIGRHEGRRAARPLFALDGKPLHEPTSSGLPAEPNAVAEIVENALQRMSPMHRRVVGLRLDGLDQKTVAARIGITSNNVGVIFHHFRTHIRELLGIEGE